jgi:N-acetyl-gamma-glutamyl-phosphate reductase
MKRIKAGVAGGAGYTGGEMVRLLLHHPHVELVFASSRSQAGRQVSEVHEDLLGQTALVFSAGYPSDMDLDILFLCLPHGRSPEYLAKAGLDPELVVIDLSRDFRLKEEGNDFVYGLPELQKQAIGRSRRIANPGCFATAIQLALLPLASAGLLRSDVHVSAITGSTGAGVGLLPTTHFTWRNNNVSVYKAFTHQHLTEIEQTIQQLQPGYDALVNFIPYRGNFSRGIIATAYTRFEEGIDKAKALYNEHYADEPFVCLTRENLHLKQVINTNYCFLHLEVHENKLMIISILDNLLKGASGQAVQNMNLVMGWPEDTGLRLKASVF